MNAGPLYIIGCSGYTVLFLYTARSLLMVLLRSVGSLALYGPLALCGSLSNDGPLVLVGSLFRFGPLSNSGSL